METAPQTSVPDGPVASNMLRDDEDTAEYDRDIYGNYDSMNNSALAYRNPYT